MARCSSFDTARVLAATLLLLTTVGITACSKKDETGKVRIVFPTAPATVNAVKNAKATGPAAQQSVSAQEGPEWNTSLNPTTGSEINCFAVFIGGGELSANTCNVSTASGGETISFGPNVGFVPAGSDVLIDTPSGSRTIHVIGLKAANSSACKSYVDTKPDEDYLSEPFVIASQQANIPTGPSTVTVSASLDVNRKITSCTFIKRDGQNSNVPKFGDKRDGKLRLAGVSALTLDAGNKSYSFSPDLTHTPATTGVASNKLYSSSRRVLSVNTSGDYAGRYLDVGAFSAQAFEPGDEVIWHVGAGASSGGPPDDPINGACGGDLFIGRWGTAKVKSTGNALGWIIIDSPIASNPAQIKNTNLAAAPGPDFCRVSITRVSNFDELRVDAGADWTMTPQAYNLASGVGGVQAIRVDRLIVDGTLKISAVGTGFAGGIAQTSGTSFTGIGTLYSNPANASGGGSSSSNGGAGGAGGAEGGSGASLTPIGGTATNSCGDFNLDSVSMGQFHACGRSSDGRLYCWGSSSNLGLLGDGVQNSRRLLPRSTNGTTYQTVASGYDHTCAINSANQLYCWGYNINGQLGDGTTSTRLIPTQIDGGNTYTKVSTGKYTTCGITTAGQLKCWGYNTNGQVGDGTVTNRSSPVVIDSGTNYADVSVGDMHTCSVTAAGVAKCWGKNISFLLAAGGATTQMTPYVVDSGTNYQQIRVLTHVCGVTTANQVKCWGDNVYGQLGRGNVVSDGTPTVVNGGAAYSKIAVGDGYSCGIATDGALRCWGKNAAHQVDSSGLNRLDPTVVHSGTGYTSVSTGFVSTCGKTASGRWQCWGNNTYGQLGNGSVNVSTQDETPLRTQLPCLAMSSGKAVIGGGGGGGLGVAGGNGGGLILLWAREISGTGALYIKSNGAIGTNATGASGGGGGGSVGVFAKSITNTTIYMGADGGSGGIHGTFPGGGGGAGTVEVRYCAASSPGFNVGLITTVGGVAGGTAANAGVQTPVAAQDDAAVCSTP
ncbi:MAG: hypothetical protein IPJ84_13065 [Bdellovibrionales bacterium]|nr:hypothetical protein [Bdellovibrionales bacterium]